MNNDAYNQEILEILHIMRSAHQRATEHEAARNEQLEHLLRCFFGIHPYNPLNGQCPHCGAFQPLDNITDAYSEG